MTKVAFLFDKKNDWLKSFVPSNLYSFKGVTIKVSCNYLEIFSYEIVFVLGYTKILPNEFITGNKLVLLVHESDLPEGRGFAPVQWQILEGKSKIVVSLIEMTQEVDAGCIVEQTMIEFDGTELFQEIRTLQAEATFALIKKFLTSYPVFSRRVQRGVPTYYPKRTLSDSEINVDLSIRENFQKLRLGNNDEWPSFFYLNGVKYILKIFKADGLN